MAPLLSRLEADQRDRIEDAVAELVDEFEGVFGEPTIRRVLGDSLDRLSEARYHTFVPLLAERFARERLEAAAAAERGAGGAPTVLFLCVQNAGRSQMAAGWLAHLAGDRVTAISGGSDPAGEVHSTAVTAMAEAGVDISDGYPKPWTDETVGAADVIVTMGCGDACPVEPDKRYLDWSLTDPAGLSLEEVRTVRDEIERRVRDLLASLEVGAGAG